MATSLEKVRTPTIFPYLRTWVSSISYTAPGLLSYPMTYKVNAQKVNVSGPFPPLKRYGDTINQTYRMERVIEEKLGQ